MKLFAATHSRHQTPHIQDIIIQDSMLSVSWLMKRSKFGAASDQISTDSKPDLPISSSPTVEKVGSITMAAAEPPHLTQEELSPGDTEILTGLKDWVSNAEFDIKNNICIDKEKDIIWTSTLSKMDFVRKVI